MEEAKTELKGTMGCSHSGRGSGRTQAIGLAQQPLGLGAAAAALQDGGQVLQCVGISWALLDDGTQDSLGFLEVAAPRQGDAEVHGRLPLAGLALVRAAQDAGRFARAVELQVCGPQDVEGVDLESIAVELGFEPLDGFRGVMLRERGSGQEQARLGGVLGIREERLGV